MGCASSSETVVTPKLPPRPKLNAELNVKCGNGSGFAPFLTPEMDGELIDMKLDAPPRSMWGQGEGTRGYCGETSF
jgi:hypothetical protein